MEIRKSFSGYGVVSDYITLEKMLAEVLEYVPYCDEHKNLWSSKIVTILQESCSQLDSLLYFEAEPLHSKPSERLTIANYYEYFGEKLSPKWVVFWGESPLQSSAL
jgi:hypothetical protein